MSSFFFSFFNDTRTQIVLLLVALDLALGIIVSIAKGDFRLSFVADFARNDILGKVVPFAVLYAGYKYASGANIVIPGVDMQVVTDAAWAVVLAALGGSLLSSLKDLGLGSGVPDQLAGHDPATPNETPR